MKRSFADGRVMSWRGLAMGAAIATAVVLIPAAFVSDTILLLIPCALLAVGAVLTRRPGKAGPITLIVVAGLFLLTNGPFLLPYFIVPASALNFILTTLAVIGCLLTPIGAVGALRSRTRQGSSLPRRLALGALGLGAISVLIGVVAAITYTHPSPQPGDLRLFARNIEFSAATLQATAGTISVFVTNHDTVLHTFTIDALGENLNVPASSTARVSFRATTGTYRYVCTLHSNMHGTLTVR